MQTLPVLGHNVWWSLAGVEIQHARLIQLLATHGFAEHTPDPPTEIKSLRRAIAAWLKARGGLRSAASLPEPDTAEMHASVRMFIHGTRGIARYA